MSIELSDINLLDMDRFAQGVPHEWFTYLRNNAPVYKHPEPNDASAARVPSHDGGHAHPHWPGSRCTGPSARSNPEPMFGNSAANSVSSGSTT